MLAERGDTLLYGGGSVGLMGTLARSMHAGGGTVVGVIPRRLLRKELAYDACDELFVTPDLRARKATLMRRADAFVALPGGFGTLEEISEALTHQHLGYHDKPVVIYNIAGFFDPLGQLFDHFYETGMAAENLRASYLMTPDLEEGLVYIDTFRANRLRGKYT